MQGEIKLYWEHNSRVNHLKSRGEIKESHVIKRTQTDSFPKNAATVRMRDIASNKPWITVHFLGEVKSQTTNWRAGGWTFHKAARVQYGRDYNGYALSGDLDEDFSFTQVDEIMKKVKKVLEV